MTADDVSTLVGEQIGGRWEISNYHGVDLRHSLVTPRSIYVINRTVNAGQTSDVTEKVWLVLEEKPGTSEGYKIIFDEEAGMFGLASAGFASDSHPILCGLYGDFITTLQAM